MGAIREWFTVVTGVVILSAIAEGIMPSGNLKKYVRLLFGLILVISICRPFINSDTEEFGIEAFNGGRSGEIENMEERERETVLRLYRANLSKQMCALLDSICEGCETEVIPDIETQDMDNFGRVKGVTVTIKTKDKELYLNDKIEELFSSTYKIDRKNIAIKYTEAE